MNNSNRLGFSLIEMLAAMSILSLIMILLSQFIVIVNQSIQKSQRPLSALEQARVVFDLMSRDLSKIVIRRDMSYLFKGGNFYGESSDEFFRFYSDQKSVDSNFISEGNRGISMIAYRIAAHPRNLNKKLLYRASQSLSWSDKSLYGLIPHNSSDYFVKALSSLEESSWSVIGRSVLGVGVDYLYRYSRPYPQNTSTEEFSLQGKYSFKPPEKLRYRSENNEQNVDVFRIAAIRISLLVINEDILNALTLQDLDEISNLNEIKRFDDPSRNQWHEYISERIKNQKNNLFWKEIKIFTRVITIPLLFSDEILDENPYP